MCLKGPITRVALTINHNLVTISRDLRCDFFISIFIYFYLYKFKDTITSQIKVTNGEIHLKVINHFLIRRNLFPKASPHRPSHSDDRDTRRSMGWPLALVLRATTEPRECNRVVSTTL